MSARLHLTNGRSVIPQLREAGIADPIVPWDDVLHDGPVPAGLGPAALAERRAAFLAACGWDSYDHILRGLRERDAALQQALPAGDRAGEHAARPIDEIVLWFEHDLYDQLQLLQILDRMPLDGGPLVTAVPDEEYLGRLPAARMQGLYAARREVTSSARLAARDAWDAFRSPDPRAIVEAMPRVSAMPRLEPALLRHLEQFPSMSNGLSRTEQQALEAVDAGTHRVADVYRAAHHEREPALFMGDAPFLVHVGALLASSRPLLARAGALRPGGNGPGRGEPATLSLDDEVVLTDDGRRVLSGELDRVRTCGIARWLGGVELTGRGPVWRWDRERGTVRLA